MNTVIKLQELKPYIRSNSDYRVFIDEPRFNLNMNSSISEEEIRDQMQNLMQLTIIRRIFSNFIIKNI